jgi:hypothetical protein
VTPPLVEQRPRASQPVMTQAPEIRSRPTQPEVATRRSIPAAQPAPVATREARNGGGHYAGMPDTDLDIPTFLRNNRGGE